MKVFIFTIFFFLIFPTQTLAFFQPNPLTNPIGSQPPENSTPAPGVVATPRLMSASACDPNDRDDCLSAFNQPINLGKIQDLPNLTFALTINQYMDECFAGLHSLPAIGTTSTVFFTDGTCLIRAVLGNSDITKVDVDIGWTDNSNTLFRKIFKDNQTNNLSTDYVNYITEGNGDFTYDINFDLISRKWLRNGNYPY